MNWTELTGVIVSWFVSPILAGVVAIGLLSFIRSTIFRGDTPGKIARLQYYLSFVLAVTIAFFALVLMKGSTLADYKPSGAWEYLLFMGVLVPYGTIITQALLRSTTGTMEDSDESVEAIFRRLQVGTSSYVAFAHGANDVANSIAPVFAIYLVVKHSGLPTPEILAEAQVPLWILLLGGAGIATGIGLLGHRVIETLSKKITTINNSRGFCVDFSAATTVVTASLLGLPVSSTHAATGAIIGTGIRGGERVQLAVLLKIFAMWIITVPAAGFVTVALYSIMRLML